MFKAMILLSRKDGMTHEDFIDWWFGGHAPLAAQLPGVRRLVFNACTPNDAVDGIAELWFDSEQAFLDAYATDLGQQVAADSLANLRDRTRLFVTEKPIVD